MIDWTVHIPVIIAQNVNGKACLFHCVQVRRVIWIGYEAMRVTVSSLRGCPSSWTHKLSISRLTFSLTCVWASCTSRNTCATDGLPASGFRGTDRWFTACHETRCKYDTEGVFSLDTYRQRVGYLSVLMSRQQLLQLLRCLYCKE
jgi:hypothetical protein